VSVAASQVLLESSSSVGNVLEQKKIVDLPWSPTTCSTCRVMAGVNVTKDNVFGAMIRKFAGVAAGNINVQRDGIPITGGRWPTGLQPATTINPDLVGEVRMILAPVDAELGRGSGTIPDSDPIRNQSIPRWRCLGRAELSLGCPFVVGQSNRRHSAVEKSAGSDARLGGPIVRTRRFLRVFDKQWAPIGKLTRPCLTPCAQRGIYRYFSGWAPSYGGGPLNAAPTWSQPTNLAALSDDALGQPGRSSTNGPRHMQYASVFGPNLSFTGGAPNADCSNAVVSGGPRDPIGIR